MACVAVIHPTDCLSHFSRPDLGRRRTPNPASARHGRRRRSPTKSPGSTSPPQKKALVMGEVKLLRRGEDLEQATASTKSLSADKPAEPTTRRTVAPVRCRTAHTSKPEPSVRNPVQKTSPPRKTVSEPAPAHNTVRPSRPASASVLLAAAKLPETFAGSNFSLSPPPSSLPIPAFCKKN